MSDLSTTIKRAYLVRLRLKPAQSRTLLRLMGARRFVWNWALRRKDEAWRADGTKLSGVDISREFTALRSTGDTAWLSSLPREPFNQTLRDFDTAWKNFFAGCAKRPRRKRFGTVTSVRFTLDQRRTLVDREGGIVQLDGIGKVRFRVTEPLLGRLRSVTVRRDAAGHWYATFTADGLPAPAYAPPSEPVVGIDLGLKSTAALSTGETVAAPKHLAAKLKRLRRYQRHYVRQRDAALLTMGIDPKQRIPKGTRITVSGRMRATKRRIGALHVKIAAARTDHQHQLTSSVIRTAAVVAIEDLSVKGMFRGMGRRAFRRSVGDAGLGEIRRQLTYKANWAGRTLSVVDRFYPSSQLCGGCGYQHRALQLRERTWSCPECGTEHDRDLNAAKNIAREGMRLLDETGPDGHTRRSRGINARGEHACAADKTPSTGQPSSLNRELTYRAAQPPTRRRRRVDPALRREG